MVTERKRVPDAKSLKFVSREAPAGKRRLSSGWGATLPDQFCGLDQSASAPPPSQMRVAGTMRLSSSSTKRSRKGRLEKAGGLTVEDCFVRKRNQDGVVRAIVRTRWLERDAAARNLHGTVLRANRATRTNIRLGKCSGFGASSLGKDLRIATIFPVEISNLGENLPIATFFPDLAFATKR